MASMLAAIAIGVGCTSISGKQANRQGDYSYETGDHSKRVSREKLNSSGKTIEEANFDTFRSFQVSVMCTIAQPFFKDKENFEPDASSTAVAVWREEVEVVEEHMKMTAREFYVSLFPEDEVPRRHFLAGVAIFRPTKNGTWKYIERYRLGKPEAKTMMREVRPGDVLWYYGMT